MSPQAIRREMRMISKVTRSGGGGENGDKERRFSDRNGAAGSDSDDDVDRRRFRTSRQSQVRT